MLNVHQPHDEIWSEADPQLQNLLVYHSDQTVAVLKLDTGIQQFRTGPVDTVPRAQLSAEGLLVAAIEDSVIVWNTATREPLYTLAPVVDSDIEGFGFNPDGAILWVSWREWLSGKPSSENQSVIQFYDTATGSELFQLNGSGMHYRMYFDPTGKQAATAGENDALQDSMWVWNLETKQPFVPEWMQQVCSKV